MDPAMVHGRQLHKVKKFTHLQVGLALQYLIQGHSIEHGQLIA